MDITWYRLMFDGTLLGDEIIQAEGHWEKSVKPSGSSGGLESIARLDDRPLAVAIFPQFRVRKKNATQWEFERWVFDLLTFADGERRRLFVVVADGSIAVDYGPCKFISLGRSESAGPHAGRWSDRVVLTFQSDTQPYFYDSA